MLKDQETAMQPHLPQRPSKVLIVRSGDIRRSADLFPPFLRKNIRRNPTVLRGRIKKRQQDLKASQEQRGEW